MKTTTKIFLSIIFAVFHMNFAWANDLPKTVTMVFPDHVKEIALGKTKEAHAELLIAGMDKNEKKYRELVKEGSAIIVQRGTNADVIQKSGGVFNVRITDGKHKGESVWVPVKWVFQNKASK